MMTMMNTGAATTFLIALSLGACTDLEQEPLTNEDLQGLSNEDRAALLDEDSALEDAEAAAEKTATTDVADVGPDSYDCYVTPALYDRGSQIEFWAYGRCTKRVYVMDLSHAGTMKYTRIESDIEVCYNNFQCTTDKDWAPDPAGGQWWQTLAWLDAREYSSSGWRSWDARKEAGY